MSIELDLDWLIFIIGILLLNLRLYYDTYIGLYWRIQID